MPRFIFGFLAMSLIASAGLLSDSLLDIINIIGKFILVVAMAGIGMRIQLRTLFQSGLRALVFGALVSVIQIIIVIIAISIIA